MLCERCPAQPPTQVLLPAVQFDAGHLPVAFHLDPNLLQSADRTEELHTVVEGFSAMKVRAHVIRLRSCCVAMLSCAHPQCPCTQGCHFAIMGSGDVAYSYVRPPLAVSCLFQCVASSPRRRIQVLQRGRRRAGRRGRIHHDRVPRCRAGVNAAIQRRQWR